MHSLVWLRYLALLEGISWLALLFIAMPLKYFGGNPYPVKVVGMTHGLLFIAFVAALVLVMNRKSISSALGAKVFIASFVPFGTFVVDGRLKQAIPRA